MAVVALGVLAVGARTAGAVDVRVLSGPGAATTVTVGATPDVAIEDHTAGAKPATTPQGPASSGETFTGEITLFLRNLVVPRAAAIDVSDPVVSVVRLFPEAGGTTVSVFVRQPVTYTVATPSALGEVRIELHSKTRPLTITGVTPRGTPRVAAPKKTGEREVAVDAESLNYDQETNTLTARGGVTLTRGDTTLTADEVVYDKTNGIAEARGHVVLTDPEAAIEGDFAHLNLDDETGWIEDANATLHPSDYVLRTNRLDKLGGPQYRVARSTFTTCRCGGLEKPSWSIGGNRTDVKLEGAGVVRGMTLRVKDVPVLYLPWMLFPANTQRQTGFLIPRISYSNRRGFQYEQPFFWAIDKSSDLTIATDVETAQRIGATAEYRYYLSRLNHGDFTFAYYNESVRGRTLGVIAPNGVAATDIPEDRFALAGHHVSPFYGGSKFYLDLFAVSDDLFLREINTFSFGGRNDLALRSARFTQSRAGVYKSWGTGLVAGEMSYYQDLIDPQELALQRLPRIEAENSMPLLGDRVVGHVRGEAVDYQREQGYAGLRGDLAPDLFVPFHLGRVLQGSVTGGVRETAYHLTDREQVAFAVPSIVPVRSGFVRAPELPALDADRTRELAEVRGRLGSELDRVFTFRHLGLEKLKHTIEPEVQYLFIPSTSRPFDTTTAMVDCKTYGGTPGTLCPATTIDCGELPGGKRGQRCPVTLFGAGFLFDEIDAINRRNFVSYGLTTRLLGRAATPTETATREKETAAAAEIGPPVPPDLETLPQGLSVQALPDFVGPPAPPGVGQPPAAPPRELLRASILHGYDISRPLVGRSHASDIDLGLRLTPTDYLGMTGNSTLSAEQSTVRGFSIGTYLREPWWQPPSAIGNYQSPTTAGISYRFVEQSVNQGVGAGTEGSSLLQTAGVSELDGSLYLRLGNYVGFSFLSRFSYNDAFVVGPNGQLVLDKNNQPKITGPHFLERDYLVRLISRCNCWVVEAGVADKFNPDERIFRVQVTLVGLGSFGRGPVQNYVGFAPLAAMGYARPGAGPARGGLY